MIPTEVCGENINTVQSDSGEQGVFSAELPRRGAGLLPEGAVEVGEVVKSAERGDLQHGFVCLHQQAEGVLHPDAEEGFADAFATAFPVGVAEVKVGDPQLVCRLLIVERLREILLEAVEHVGGQNVAPFAGEVSGAEARHPDQQLREMEFEHQAGVLVVAQVFAPHLPHQSLDAPVGVDEIELVADHAGVPRTVGVEDGEEVVFVLEFAQKSIDHPPAEEDVAQIDVGIQLEGGEVVGADQAEEAGAEGVVLAVDHQRAAAGEDVEDLPEIPPVENPAFFVVHRAFVVAAQYGHRQMGGEKIHRLEQDTFLIHSGMLPMLFCL